MRMVLFLGLALLGGCGSKEESATVAGTTFTSNDKDGTAKIATKDGAISVVDGPGAAIARMPEYAPQYPGSTIQSAIRNETSGAETNMFTLVTGDAPKAVSDFYQAQFAKHALTVKPNLAVENGAMISAEGGGRKVSLVLSQEGRETTAVVSVTAMASAR